MLVDAVSLPAGDLRPGAYLFLAPLGGSLPFAMMSGHDRDSLDLTRLEKLDGYFGLLSKPFHSGQLTAAIKEMSDFNR